MHYTQEEECDASNAAIEQDEEEAQARREAVRIKQEQRRLYTDTMHKHLAAQYRESEEAAALVAKTKQMRSEAADPSGEDDPFGWREDITGHEVAEELNAASSSSSCPPAVGSRTCTQAEQA